VFNVSRCLWQIPKETATSSRLFSGQEVYLAVAIPSSAHTGSPLAEACSKPYGTVVDELKLTATFAVTEVKDQDGQLSKCFIARCRPALLRRRKTWSQLCGRTNPFYSSPGLKDASWIGYNCVESIGQRLVLRNHYPRLIGLL